MIKRYVCDITLEWFVPLRVRQDLQWASLQFSNASALHSVLSFSHGGEFTLSTKVTQGGFRRRVEHTPGYYPLTRSENGYPAHMTNVILTYTQCCTLGQSAVLYVLVAGGARSSGDVYNLSSAKIHSGRSTKAFEQRSKYLILSWMHYNCNTTRKTLVFTLYSPRFYACL